MFSKCWTIPLNFLVSVSFHEVTLHVLQEDKRNKKCTSDFLLALPSSSDSLLSSGALRAIICSSFSSGLLWESLFFFFSSCSSSATSFEWCGTSCASFPPAFFFSCTLSPLLVHCFRLFLLPLFVSFSSSSSFCLCADLLSVSSSSSSWDSFDSSPGVSLFSSDPAPGNMKNKSRSSDWQHLYQTSGRTPSHISKISLLIMKYFLPAGCFAFSTPSCALWEFTAWLEQSADLAETLL